MAVIDFPVKEDLVWVCGCGCSTHFVYEDGHIECASCRDTVTGAWDAERKDEAPEPKERPEQFSKTLIDFDSEESALRDVLRLADKERSVAVIVMQEDGLTRAWGKEFDTDEKRAWFDRGLNHARRSLLE